MDEVLEERRREETDEGKTPGNWEHPGPSAEGKSGGWPSPHNTKYSDTPAA